MSHEVHQKWGFGMAPLKPETQARRSAAAQEVIAFLEHGCQTDVLPAALSDVKGLFARVARQDQWDWFATSRTLGYPSAEVSKLIAKAVGSLRRRLAAGDEDEIKAELLLLRRLPCRPCLRVLLREARIADEEGAGWVYLLSTRELPDLLKIGMTTRTVEERLRELNGATGIAFPFGVRRCWRVREPANAERLIHRALADYRVRIDREFFRASYSGATRIIDATLHKMNLELRTLDNLVAVSAPVG